MPKLNVRHPEIVNLYVNNVYSNNMHVKMYVVTRMVCPCSFHHICVKQMCKIESRPKFSHSYIKLTIQPFLAELTPYFV